MDLQSAECVSQTATAKQNCIMYCILYLNDQFQHTYLHIEAT